MAYEPLPDGVNPNERFYDLQGRRNSGISNQHFVPDGNGKDSGRPGGRCYQQGIEIIDIQQSRTLLPILGRGDRYRYVIQYRDEHRMLTNVCDSRENNYFTDTALLNRNRYTWREQEQYFFPNDELITDPIAKDLIKQEGVILENNPSIILVDHPQAESLGIWSPAGALVKRSNSVEISLPDGGIRQVPEYYLDTVTYGEGREYRGDTPYFDLEKYDAVAYIENNGPLGMFPETSRSPSYTEDFIFNGIIEPLELRLNLYGKNTFAVGEPYPGMVRGDSVDTNYIVFQYPPPRIGTFTGGQYEDVVTKGFRSKLGKVDDGDVLKEASFLLEGEYVTADIYFVDKYEDRLTSSKVWMDEEMLNFMLSMDSTLDEGHLAMGNVDACVGFDAPARERFGTNAYRDLLR